MNLRWFVSSKVRHATHMWKHVRNILNAQRDILSSQAVENMTVTLAEFRAATLASLPKAELEAQMKKLEEAANKWLKPYPHASYRENIEVFLVALAVAMGIRTFFVQPFKIPTGSMQPTLYGVTSVPDFSNINSETEAREQAQLRDSLQAASGLERAKEWIGGGTFLTYKTDEAGEFQGISRPLRFLIFNFKQTIWISGKPHTMWFPPDSGGGATYNWGNLPGLAQAMFSNLPVDEQSIPDLERRMGLRRGRPVARGEELIKIKFFSGDHLFVDRFTYNFRRPTRGEIVVFATAGVAEEKRLQWRMPENQFYIKRMVGLSNEHVKIGEDHHLLIDGKRLDSSTPHFENVYAVTQMSTDPLNPYLGHLPMMIFANGGEFQIRSNHFMVMGDNTRNSLDSRFFGDIDSDYIIGKQFFVYWPLTKRFGWSNR